uniref:Uncharacterized protein n=1 Tax=Triticum urartu TaxID=4572 RepID=A0A8R7PRR0_TRIUA
MIGRRKGREFCWWNSDEETRSMKIFLAPFMRAVWENRGERRCSFHVHGKPGEF